MLVALVLVVAGSASAWAAMTVLRPASDPLDASSHTYVAVVPGEVGSSLNLNTVAEWVPVPVGVNRATGVVTDVRARAGDEVSQGATLYSVGLRPVIVAEGDVPAFRAVSKDVEGPDVAQVQRMLASAGFYGGPDDGEAGEGTVAAIKAWQKSLGLEETGIVEAGDLIFVPHLPTRIALDTKLVRRGATLAG